MLYQTVERIKGLGKVKLGPFSCPNMSYKIKPG